MKRISSATVAVAVLAAVLTAAGCGSGGSEFGSGLSADAIMKKFRAQGLPVRAVTVYTAVSDPNHILGRPGGYTSKISFRDTRIKDVSDPTDIDAGGSIEVFGSVGDAKKRAAYGKAVTSIGPLFNEYLYRRDRVFLRLSRELTPEQAKRYEAVLQKLGH